MSKHLLGWCVLLVACSLAPAASLAESQALPGGFLQEMPWRMVGPFRGGRTRALAGIASQPYVFYIGAVNGGVWKTDDAGQTWQPIFDAQPTQSIGAIAIAPSDPNIVYVGSGEGLHRPDLSVGNGIYRSADAGRTWEHLGLNDGQQIPELAVDPRDPNRLFAAVLGHPYGANTERGIYRSIDGGRSWQQVLYKDEHTGGSAVAIDPVQPDTIYASLWEGRLGPWEDKNSYDGTNGGLFKSTDGGSTWHALTKGLPATMAQVNIAIAPSAHNTVFAIVGTTEPGDYASAAGLGLYRSDDAGEHWARVTQDPRPALRIGGGDLPILRVDPKNPAVLYSASLVTTKSTDGGKSWISLRGAPGGDDYQNLWINPLDPNIFLLVSDQGALVTLNGGRSWTSWFNQPTAQLYHAGVSNNFPYRLCAGQQESGSVCINSRGNDGQITVRDWHPVGAIEYGYVVPDPLDADIVYGAGRNVVTRYHLPTGQLQNITPIPLRGGGVRVDRTQPLLFSPFDPHTMYYAAHVLYKTSDAGQTWQTISPDLARPSSPAPASVGTRHKAGAENQRGVIYAVAASPKDNNLLWAGTDDGLIWVTHDGGQHWSDVTPLGLIPWSKVTQIEASHFDANSAYASVSRMRLDDLHPHIYRTRDGGKSWQSISAGLPNDAAVNTIREDTVRPGLLFAATENAVWVSFDDGDQWSSLQNNLPHTSMRDLAIHDQDLIVATHGRGFWVLDDISRLRQLNIETTREPLLLQPAMAYRVRRSTWTDTPLPPDEPMASNPPAGAVLEYFLPREAKGIVELEIIDTHGEVVRRYRSDDTVQPTREELTNQLIPPYWVAQTRPLPRQAGMHRFIWDLRYAPPESIAHGYQSSAVPYGTPRGPEGPMAAPGRYAARLTIEGKRLEASFTLLQDPRVSVTPEALKSQLQLSRQLAAALSESSGLLLSARSVHEQLQALRSRGPLAKAIETLDTRVAALLESKDKKELLPEVQDNINELYAAVTSGDAQPNAAQHTSSADNLALLARLKSDWLKIEHDIPRLNSRLRSAKLADIRPSLPPKKDVNAAAEE